MGFLLSAWAVKVALDQPEWDHVFEPGQVLESSQGQITLEDEDLLAEPGEIESHQVLNRFYERQDEILRVISDPSFPFLPRPRRLADLPALFWIPLLVGLGSLAITGWIWALRARDLSIALFALSGLSVFVSAVPSAIYTTRDVALPSALFRVLETLNAWGAAWFGITMLALFLIYPVRMRHWKAIALAETVFFGIWIAAYSMQWTPDPMNVSALIAALMLALCAAIGAQFFATRANPTARASLVWLGLSVLLGAGAFVVFNTLPLLFGMDPMQQGYAFLFFLIIYLGLAAGLTRYRLFEVGQWAFRFLFYIAGAVMLVVLDAVLIFMLGMDRLPALGLALLAVGFLYLPLRDLLWGFFSRKGRLETHELLAESLHVAFAPSTSQRAQRWENLLRKLFDPLEMGPAPGRVEKIEILEDGLTLAVPPVASASSMKLAYPWGGRGLFSSSSKELAAQIVSLIEQAESNRDAYDRGVTEERRRVAQDLHDDVGARLLTGLYLADENLRTTIQAAIADIRSIVSGISGEKVPLERLLAELRHETHRRLETAKIELQWPLSEGPELSRLLDYRQHKAISSGVREIVSNVIRHAGAKRLQVEIKLDPEIICLSFSDNGSGLPASALNGEAPGFGLKGLERRLFTIGGKLELKTLSPGSRVILSVPFEVPTDPLNRG
ncbi:MAG: hypothetical protein KF802_10600 [Bdellovibrionaceae bacterium]|nr:hypothetical protein [Pseudobdellovibrionaceae bacterium]